MEGDHPNNRNPAVRIEISKINTETPEWAYEIVKFLINGELPHGREEVTKVKNKAAHFTMVNGALYK